MRAVKTISIVVTGGSGGKTGLKLPKVSPPENCLKVARKPPFPGLALPLPNSELADDNNLTLRAFVENNQQQLFNITSNNGNNTNWG